LERRFFSHANGTAGQFYVKSLKGTNPPNAKEPQGELYDENQAAGATSVTDSTAAAAPAK